MLSTNHLSVYDIAQVTERGVQARGPRFLVSLLSCALELLLVEPGLGELDRPQSGWYRMSSVDVVVDAPPSSSRIRASSTPRDGQAMTLDPGRT